MDIHNCTLTDQVLDSPNITSTTAHVEVNSDLAEQTSLTGRYLMNKILYCIFKFVCSSCTQCWSAFRGSEFLSIMGPNHRRRVINFFGGVLALPGKGFNIFYL